MLKKIKGVPDLRKYQQKLPGRYWTQQTASRWKDTVEIGCTVMITAFQFWQAIKKAPKEIVPPW
jgi:hypothetical protein